MAVRKANYENWPDCIALENDQLEVVVTTGLGPRIVRMGQPGGPNAFVNFNEHLDGPREEFRFYGGHRLWHSPEDEVRTYQPDNVPMESVEETDDSVRIIQKVEKHTGIQKEILLQIDPTEPRVMVWHRLTNRGMWPVEFGVWAISAMAPGGVAVASLSRNSHPQGLLPNGGITLWPYTDLSDPRIFFGEKLIGLRQDKERGPIKFGLNTDQQWAAYLNHGNIFIKRFLSDPEENYPDFGSRIEFYTNQKFLEVETLGPIKKVEPGDSISHREDWYYYTGVNEWQNEKDLDKIIQAYLGKTEEVGK